VILFFRLFYCLGVFAETIGLLWFFGGFMSVVPDKKFVFVSFANAHTGANIGCVALDCAVGDVRSRVDELGLMPDVCAHVRAFETDSAGIDPMELGVFYSSDQMRAMGFGKA